MNEDDRLSDDIARQHRTELETTEKWRVTVRRGDEHLSEVCETADLFVPRIAQESLINRMPPLPEQSYSLTVERI